MVKISEEGIGKLITKEQMKKDKVLPHNQCCTVFLKPEMTFLDPKLFSMVRDNELRDSTYTAFFKKEMDDQCKKIVQAYHPHKDAILFSQVDSSGNTYIKWYINYMINV